MKKETKTLRVAGARVVVVLSLRHVLLEDFAFSECELAVVGVVGSDELDVVQTDGRGVVGTGRSDGGNGIFFCLLINV